MLSFISEWVTLINSLELITEEFYEAKHFMNQGQKCAVTIALYAYSF